MAVQICPLCHARHITWHIDEESSLSTQWACGHCHYSAAEDESRAADCRRCASKASMLLLYDDTGAKRWCIACGLFETTNEPPPE